LNQPNQITPAKLQHFPSPNITDYTSRGCKSVITFSTSETMFCIVSKSHTPCDWQPAARNEPKAVERKIQLPSSAERYERATRLMKLSTENNGEPK